KTPEQIALSEEVERAGEELYRVMTEAGISVLFDDRDVSPGVKFADADLLGMPVRLTLGAKGFARGVVERLDRATGEERELVLTDDILSVALTELRLAILAGAA
ncbi:MAG: proline--tRNA ligase, partial [Actinobacteria bacterium]|nr:proline--tRNA ligase [Actinomycetota bacterium]